MYLYDVDPNVPVEQMQRMLPTNISYEQEVMTVKRNAHSLLTKPKKKYRTPKLATYNDLKINGVFESSFQQKAQVIDLKELEAIERGIKERQAEIEAKLFEMEGCAQKEIQTK